MAKVFLDKDLEHKIAKHPGVNSKLSMLAHQGAGVARGRLLAHRITGLTKITVSHGGVDYFINMVGPGAPSIEWGHVQSGMFEHLAPDSVKGLHILGATRMEMRIV